MYSAFPMYVFSLNSVATQKQTAADGTMAKVIGQSPTS